MKKFIANFLISLLAIISIQSSSVFAQEKSIVVSSTTSTEQSGLFGFILPIFKMKTGIDVKVVAVEIGRAHV